MQTIETTQLFYTVHAYCWGDRECHSYSVGVHLSKDSALAQANHEEDYRGLKYKCEVLEWNLNGYEGGTVLRVIKALPEVKLVKVQNKIVKQSDT